MSHPNYSIEELYSFIEYVIDKGLIKRATAMNWKNASTRLLSILDETETKDLRTIDVDDLCKRYANINGKDVTPSSLQVYRSRLKTALSDFITYTDNPMSYSPSITERASRKKKNASNKNTEPTGKTQQQTPNLNTQNPIDSNSGIAFPIPLRDNLIVQIMNVPFDLTEMEAEKIAMVIKALAVSKN